MLHSKNSISHLYPERPATNGRPLSEERHRVIFTVTSITVLDIFWTRPPPLLMENHVTETPSGPIEA